jgi:hypothetical protein
MVEIKRMIPDQAYPPLGCGFTTRRAGDARQIFDQSPFEIPKFPMCSCHVLAKTITDTQVCYYTHPTCSSQKMPKKKAKKNCKSRGIPKTSIVSISSIQTLYLHASIKDL